MRTKLTVMLIVLGVMLAALAVGVALLVWLGRARGLVLDLSLAAAVLIVYRVAVGPWQRRWGATDEEVVRVMPGDDLLPVDAPGTTRAIGIDAMPAEVFPWLLQIGYGRGGWYSYDWIDNDGKPSVEQIDLELQRLDAGDRIEMMPGFGPVVKEIVPNDHILSGGERDSWCLAVYPTPDGGTRLVSRWRQDWERSVATWLWTAITDPGAFIMERKMLLRLRRIAEANRGATAET